MTLEEIKKEMAAREMSITSLANELGITADGLGRVLSGKRPLTEQLAKHIAFVLGQRECIFVYKVNASTQKVEELTAGRGCTCERDRVQAMQGIIAHNMELLAKAGANVGWTPEQLKAWGLEPEAKVPLHIEAGVLPGRLPRVAGRAD